MAKKKPPSLTVKEAKNQKKVALLQKGVQNITELQAAIYKHQ